MRTVLLLFLLSSSLAYSQSVEKPEEDNLNLEDRFKEMKAAAQTFKDYKVIKEVALDKVWKIVKDSMAKKEELRLTAEMEIANLKEELTTMRNSIQVQEASMKDIVYDSTHISVFGIPFSKTVFILLTTIIVAALVFILSMAYARVKIANSLVKEKTVIADSIAHEFDDFKKKSMEKQTKLSRELQNERNKLLEYRKL